MESMLKPMLPYLLQEALGVYSKRQGTFGRTPMDFSPLQAMLGKYMEQYQPRSPLPMGQRTQGIYPGGGGLRNITMAEGDGGIGRGVGAMGGFNGYERSVDAY